ncbi:MAG: cellulose biosynthesis cyclic di-GMP-binding regulatory protein BcsB [Pseudomonadota bacterium]
MACRPAQRRLISRAGLFAAITACVFAAPGAFPDAAAQEPFALTEPSQPATQPPASDAAAGTVAAENGGAPPANLSSDGTAGPGADLEAVLAGPPPFDINEDGLAPAVIIPEDVVQYARPSTTVSPLSNGRQPSPVVPIDALTEDERADLTALLRADTELVKELRVNLQSADEWRTAVVDRPIVPYPALRLDGEIDTASWNFYISAAEAARGGTLTVAFTNSVLVLPEASRLRVFLNGRQIAQTSIDSPDRTKVIALPVSSELLRAGENTMRLETEMRHRIDCSINATFELWTRIDTRLTGITFPGGAAPLAGLADLPGVGVGTSGATRLRVLQRTPASIVHVDRMLRAVQAAAVRGRFRQPLVEVMGTMTPPEPQPGAVNLVIGSYDQVRDVSPEIPREAGLGPLSALIDTPALGPTVVISGPNDRAVEAALARFSVQPGAAASTAAGSTPRWLAPDAAVVDGATTVTLRDTGIETINFSGRRFVTAFNVTLPPDFYASAYGEARLLLDAAYSSEVRPGSTLSVFVNGVLSTAINFTSSDGEVFDDFPISLVMQSFRPGVNTVEIVADLRTEADETCLPGGTVPARDRFALFSSTQLVFPAFARVGQIPNLASFVTNGFPYPLDAERVHVHVGTGSLDTMGAAGTLLARVAVNRGLPLPTTAVESATPYPDSGLIVVGSIQEVENVVLETTGAGSVVPLSWSQPFPGVGGSPADAETLDRFDDDLLRLRQQLRQEDPGLERPATEAPERPPRIDPPAEPLANGGRERDRWFQELQEERGLGDIIADALSSARDMISLSFLFGSGDGAGTNDMAVPEDSTLLLAQAVAPGNSRTAWTLVTAPTPSLLSTSLAAIGTPEEWNRISGRITAYGLADNSINVIDATSIDYLATMPLSLTNARLIAANWFSMNSGVYAVVLVIVAFLLGVITYLVVTPLGRQD